MATIADRIYEIVRDLPESKAAKVLDFAEHLKSKENAGEEDFFALAGLWENRDIDLTHLRNQAWPERRG